MKIQSNLMIGNTDIFDSIMPPYGKSRIQTPIYDPVRMGFILNDRETVGHNRCHSLVRLHNNIVVVEQIGTFHAYTYTNSLAVYTFDNSKLQLVSLKTDYSKEHYDIQKVRTDTNEIVFHFLKTQIAAMYLHLSDEEIKAKAVDTVDRCYTNILDDESFQIFQQLPKLLSQIDNNIKLLTVK